MYYVLDTGTIPAIAAFVEKVMEEHPELDRVVNNAGVRRRLDVKRTSTFKTADEEIDINSSEGPHAPCHWLPPPPS